MQSQHPLEPEDSDLLLDELYNSPNPAVKKALATILREEMMLAQERAMLRLAVQFRALLPPAQQRRVAGLNL